MPDARAVFEMTVRKLVSNPDNIHKAKPIFAFLHEYESRYGDLVQVINLETRMRELFPNDPTLSQFAHRYATSTFDPTTVRPIISPSQARPRSMVSIEQRSPGRGTPTRYLEPPSTNSPKRPYPKDDHDDDGNRPRKFMRGESPLKGVSRRLEQPKRLAQSNGSGAAASVYRPQPSAAPLPRDVVHLLSIIPPASAYKAGRFSAEKLVDLLRRIDVPSSISQLRPPQQSVHGLGVGSQPYGGKCCRCQLSRSQFFLCVGLLPYSKT
jgi:cleavage stimulation factor subunit 3